MVGNLPQILPLLLRWLSGNACQVETWVQSLDWEDPLEKEMTIHSCLGSPVDGEAWWVTVHGVPKSWHDLKSSKLFPQGNFMTLKETEGQLIFVHTKQYHKLFYLLFVLLKISVLKIFWFPINCLSASSFLPFKVVCMPQILTTPLTFSL